MTDKIFIDNIAGRFHMTEKSGANILFFHGNGEIVADYDDLGQMYNRLGINFLPMDYRGYGRSTGRLTVSPMLNDSHLIFEFARKWLKENNYTGRLAIMGRSLGSASALEIPDANHNDIFFHGLSEYMTAIKMLVNNIASN